MRTEEECWWLLKDRAFKLHTWFMNDHPSRVHQYATLRGLNGPNYAALVLNEIIDMVISPLIEATTHYKEWLDIKSPQYHGYTFLWRDEYSEHAVIVKSRQLAATLPASEPESWFHPDAGWIPRHYGPKDLQLPLNETFLSGNLEAYRDSFETARNIMLNPDTAKHLVYAELFFKGVTHDDESDPS